MIKLRAAFIAFLLGLALCAGQAAADTAASPMQLKSDVTVEGRVVTLGDLFIGTVPGPERPVLEAPAPGQSYQLDATWLGQLAHAWALPWRPSSQFDLVRLTRASVGIETGVLRMAISDALAERGLIGEIGMDVDGGMPNVAISLGGEPTVAVQRLAFDPQSGRFSAALVAPAIGTPEVILTVTGRVYGLVDVPVLNRRLAPGETVAESDIEWTTLPADRIGATVVVDAADLLGKTPRRPIRPGVPIRMTDLAVAIAVTKGSLVTLALQTPTMQLTVQGKAMQNGAIGETIRVLNTTSNRTLEGVVVSPTEVAVLPSTPSFGAVQ